MFNVTESSKLGVMESLFISFSPLENQLLLKVAANLKVSPSSSASASANSNAVAVAKETVSTVSSATSIQISPNVIYQVRSKKKKRDRENK